MHWAVFNGLQEHLVITDLDHKDFLTTVTLHSSKLAPEICPTKAALCFVILNNSHSENIQSFIIVLYLVITNSFSITFWEGDVISSVSGVFFIYACINSFHSKCSKNINRAFNINLLHKRKLQVTLHQGMSWSFCNYQSKAAPWSLDRDRCDRLNPHSCTEDFSLKGRAQSDRILINTENTVAFGTHDKLFFIFDSMSA